jgi:hypothetical protein
VSIARLSVVLANTGFRYAWTPKKRAKLTRIRATVASREDASSHVDHSDVVELGGARRPGVL